ncbi:DNA translocase FtsK [Acinetobacter lactucae]|uniref:DNA translocase FtsK n=1 Tax=Acinetobacter lactucae TaxID=1785128 RepID=A0AB35JZC6_9GAMM|nr:DNA translocase FtsK [Acinetobacter lactucae]MDD9318586.1 DNA translocase FtsK [Acinetobacter lactucae]
MDMELYKSVVDFVRNHNKASTSHIQRAFNLSYNRAVPLMDKLEEDYVISPMSANGKREVYPEIVAELQQQIKVLTADLKESQSDFAYAYKSVTSWTERAYKQREKVELIKNEVERFQQSGSPLDLNQFLSNLIELATFKNDHEFTDHLLVPKKDIEDWYLDEDEGLWLDHDGIDGNLCELDIGKVQPVKHKEYLITQSNTLYAARVWDGEDDHIAWKLFESEEAALEAAKYCKQMYDASESGAEQ